MRNHNISLIHLILKTPERGLHTLVQLLKVGLDLGLSVLPGVLELHGAQLVEDVAHGLPNDHPRDLVLALRGALHGVAGEVVERHDVLEHAHGLVEGAVAVVGGVAVLLEEVVLEELGHLQGDLVGLGQRCLTCSGKKLKRHEG